MKVLVVFEFDDVDPNSEEANEIVESISEATEVMGSGFDASNCYVQEVYGEDEPDGQPSEYDEWQSFDPDC